MTLSWPRRRFCTRACSAAALLATGLAGCDEGSPSGPSAAAPTVGAPPASPGAPAPERPPTEPLPPAPRGIVLALPVVPAQATAEGLRVVVGAGSPLADVWGSARTQVERGGIVRDVLITRTGAASFVAVSGVCTHDGCIVSRVDRPVFECPCHGSRYDHIGAVLRGPAAAALPRFAVTFADGVLDIQL